MAKKLIDISVPLRDGMAHWPGDVPFTRIQRTRIGEDHAVSNDSLLVMSAHCGTHVDAPRHFFPEGSTVEAMELSLLVGPAYVADCTAWQGHLTEEAFAGVPSGVERLLVKTGNGKATLSSAFSEHFIGLTESGALWLKRRGIRLFGLDYFSIGALDDGSIARAHRAFLSQVGAVALEGLCLSEVEAGWYELICLPLKLSGCDGAPCRAILVREEAE